MEFILSTQHSVESTIVTMWHVSMWAMCPTCCVTPEVVTGWRNRDTCHASLWWETIQQHLYSLKCFQCAANTLRFLKYHHQIIWSELGWNHGPGTGLLCLPRSRPPRRLVRVTPCFWANFHQPSHHGRATEPGWPASTLPLSSIFIKRRKQEQTLWAREVACNTQQCAAPETMTIFELICVPCNM